MDDAADAPALVRSLRIGAIALLAALIILDAAWELWLAPIGARTLTLKVVPLALAMPGLVRRSVRTFRWVCLLVWLYVAEGVVRAASDRGPSARLGAIEVALAIALFGCCGAYVRVRTRGAVPASIETTPAANR